MGLRVSTAWNHSLALSDETAEITDHLGSPILVSLKNIDRYLQTHPDQSLQ